MVCEAMELSRATLYRHRAARSQQLELGLALKKRGPRTRLSDAELTEEIRKVLAESVFTGEGHRKAWARLRFRGVRSSQRRVLRLMREAKLLAPHRPIRILGPREHNGTIVAERPDQMWGADGTTAFTLAEGWATVFAVIDHCTAECIGIHVAKPGTRFEALEPVRHGVRERFGSIAQGVAAGLTVRHDHGSQFMSDVFQDELRFLGIESSPSFVRSPEGNGCIERFFRTLKEQLLWVTPFRTVEELRVALHDFAKRYNEHWILERHNYLTPSQARRELVKAAA
jgi:transposase InsO family protein